MNKLESYHVFVTVIEQESFTKAANVLFMSQPSISRIIKQLENELGCPLINRHTHAFHVTEDGQKFYIFAKQILDQIKDEESQFKMLKAEPEGLIRMTAPSQFFQDFILPKLPRFYQKYPKIKLNIFLDTAVQNLDDRQFDLAIRVGNTNSDTYPHRIIGGARRILIASPGYLEEHGTPSHPKDLETHNCILFKATHSDTTWVFQTPRKDYRISVSGNIVVNNMNAAAQLAKASQGIAYLSHYYAKDALKQNQVIQLLPNYTQTTLPITVLHTFKHHTPKKICAVMEFLQEELNGMGR